MLARLERIGWLLGLVKLANVGAAMLWGFAVTFVFVRVLPIEEFRIFLLLVAFANFTVSADFGFSGILYARLRQWRLGGVSDFDPGEPGVLLSFMTAIVVAGGALIGTAIATGLLPTGEPVLFLAFYGLSALNIFAFLARRALAALDHNLLWEGVDLGRRMLAITLLLAVLAGVPVLWSVALQAALMIVTLILALMLVHRSVGMRMVHWLPAGRERIAAVLGRTGADMRSTMLLTLSDVAAYNAPYFTIAAATPDPRPLLLFDFAYKMGRALSALIRALVETMLPALTRDWHAGAPVADRIARLRFMATAGAVSLGMALVAAGPALFRILYDGRAVPTDGELAMIGAMLVGLSLLCVSTYVHQGIGMFRPLVPPSLVFLAGTLLSVVPAMIAAPVGGDRFALWFLAALAIVHLLVAARHFIMLKGLARE